jgi:hypothetical protein
MLAARRAREKSEPAAVRTSTATARPGLALALGASACGGSDKSVTVTLKNGTFEAA